jgi:RNase adaptor protein for sRNA GlmZ degradation
MKQKLNIDISSFSYIKNGIPQDTTENGGGFVFDCRGILNPGRIDEYKTQSGLDIPVQEYLKSETKMPEFIALVKQILDISIQDYIARGFSHLKISFGCTGGQHRSVFSTEEIATYITEKYGNDVTIIKDHLAKELWRKTL